MVSNRVVKIRKNLRDEEIFSPVKNHETGIDTQTYAKVTILLKRNFFLQNQLLPLKMVTYGLEPFLED